MAQLFWRSRLARRSRKIIRSLPDLPADIDDNVFIALGTQAAEADKTSKAYDEFLFSEEGYEQMPYEDGVDEVLTLQEQRNAERKGRATLPIRMRIEYLEKLIEAKKQAVLDAENQRDSIVADLNKESEILGGSAKGEDGGVWEGVPPDTTSRAKHLVERIKEWGVFAIVAGADYFVVFQSLRAVTNNEEEARWLSFPAVGVQIIFPHLIGRAIADSRSKTERRGKDRAVALIVLVAWAAYIFAMAVLRTDLIADFYFKRYSKPLEGNLALSISIFSVLILVGLGLWVLIKAMNANPHKNRFSRLKYVYFNKQRSLRKAEASKAKAEADLEAELKVLAEVTDQWERRAQSYGQVSEAAKSVYRRALVNHLGTPEFTSEYLPESKFKLKQKRKSS